MAAEITKPRFGRRAKGALVALGILLLSLLGFWGHRVMKGWQARRAARLVARMSLEEKIQMLGGNGDYGTQGLPRLGIPDFRMSDGPFGVSRDGPATAMAGGVILAASWNPDLAERIGNQLGRDARAKGVHLLLGPGVNLCLAPMNGRNFEYFGEDPHLASRMAVSYIKGVQSQGVAATIKHFMANNSEFNRPFTDAIIDERALREIYMPAFEAAVKEARVGAMMTSYNRVNGQYMTQNSALTVDVLRGEWGFDGLLMSDWGATHDGLAAARSGLDLEMPTAVHMTPEKMLPMVRDGRLPESLIDEKVGRILRTALRFGWLDRSQSDLSLSRYNEEGCRMALDAAREGMVLLKNEGALLPLDRGRIKTLAIVGPNAATAVPTGGGSARVRPFGASSFLQSLKEFLGPNTQMLYARGLPSLDEAVASTKYTLDGNPEHAGLRAEYFSNRELKGPPMLSRTETSLHRGSATEAPQGSRSARWTGWIRAEGPSELFVKAPGYDSGFYRMFLDGRLVLDNWRHALALVNGVPVPDDGKPHRIVLERWDRGSSLNPEFCVGLMSTRVDPQARAIAAKADAVLVAAGFDPDSESEGSDRTFALPLGQNGLIQEMASINPRTIVAMTSGGGVDMQPWLDRIPALVQVWYPGQEGGTALAELLFGKINPSGRLPISFERRWEDNPVRDSYYPQGEGHRVEYKAGIFVGYRGYQKRGVKPLFPFGYGLSYTTFQYGNLTVDPRGFTCEVSFDVTNTGSREGAEVAQVYIGGPKDGVPRPDRELKGFAKVMLAPGETRRVRVSLDQRSFSRFDTQAHRWQADPGLYSVMVGRSSEAIELSAGVQLPR